MRVPGKILLLACSQSEMHHGIVAMDAHGPKPELSEDVWALMARRPYPEFLKFYQDQTTAQKIAASGHERYESRREKRKLVEANRRQANFTKNRRTNMSLRYSWRSGDHHAHEAHSFALFCWGAKTGPCYWCGQDRALTIEHMIPVSRGGAHSVDNLQTACMKCNSQKHHRTPEEYIAWLQKRGLTPALDSTIKTRWLQGLQI